MRYLGFHIGGHDSNLSIYDTTTNEFSYFLLERLTGIKFYEKTGIPFLLNTSLNCDGQPILIVRNSVMKCLEVIS